MATAIVERIQQEYQEDIVDERQVSPYERGLEETKDLAIASARTAGLDKEAEHIEQCGKKYAVSRCNQCGEYVGHAYHCSERICPTCYYRNLFRFMNRHRQSWDEDTGFLIIKVNCGAYRSYNLEDGLTYAKEQHKQLIKRFPLLRGGVYHIELRWDDNYHDYHIIYHYLLNAHINYAFEFPLALEGQGLCEDYKAFNTYSSAQSYFIRHSCKYPADILLDYTKLRLYLSLVKRHKLIQGFGQLYRITGGLNRGVNDRKHPACPICGGKLSHVGLTTKEYVFWDAKLKYYKIDPGAPGL